MPHEFRIPKASGFRAIWISLYYGMPLKDASQKRSNPNSEGFVASIPVVACDVFVEALEQTLEITKPTDAYPYGHKCENGYGEKKKNGPECFPHIVDLSYEKVL